MSGPEVQSPAVRPGPLTVPVFSWAAHVDISRISCIPMSAEISFRIAPLLVPISKRPDPDFGQDSDSAGSRCECAGQQDLPHPRRQPRRRRRIGCRLRYGPTMWQNHIWIEIWRRRAAQPRISLRIVAGSLTSRLRRYAHVVSGKCLAPDVALYARVSAVGAATRERAEAWPLSYAACARALGVTQTKSVEDAFLHTGVDPLS